MKRWIAVLLMLTLITATAAVAAADGLGIGVVKGGWLRLRTAPNTLAPVIGRYYTGTKVTVHSSTGSWYYVTAPDGQTGYMSRNYITLSGGGATPPSHNWSGTPSGETGYVTSQNGRGVRLRSSPSAASSGNIIGFYSVGTKLTILQRGSGWHYIQIGSQTGYMMSQFIITYGGQPSPGTKPDEPATPVVPVTPDTNYTAWITSQNGKGVRLRTGPGVNYSLLGTFPVGTQVTVLKNLGAWSYVRINSHKTGYMMSTFLTTNPDSAPEPQQPTASKGSLTDAQITIQGPIIGDHLYVYVTPDKAEYTVHWYNEAGTLLGSGNGYPVKSSDKGHRIRARVTGKNGWSGTIETLFTDLIGGSGSPDTPAEKQQLTGQVFLPSTVKVNDTLSPNLQNLNASAITITWYVDGLQYAQQNSLKVTSAMAGKTVQVIITASGYEGSLTAVTSVQKAPEETTDKEPPAKPIMPDSEKPSKPEKVPALEGEPSEPIEPPKSVPADPVTSPETPSIEAVTPSEPEAPSTESASEAVTPAAPAEPAISPTESETPAVELIKPSEPVAEAVTPSEPEIIVPAVESAVPVTAAEPEAVTSSEPTVELIVP